MKKVLLIYVITSAILAVTLPGSLEAYRVRQWVAPMECVIDYGLPTQVILTEEECDDLLNPPGTGNEPVPTIVGGLLQPDLNKVSTLHYDPSVDRLSVVNTFARDEIYQGDLIVTSPIENRVADTFDVRDQVAGFYMFVAMILYVSAVIAVYRWSTKYS